MRSQHWFDAVQKCQHNGEAYALITVLGCSGSTPRDQSSKMVVTGEKTYDTIGGGQLEFVVTNKARELLAHNNDAQQIDHFPLGASLGQCCGGSATVLIETFAACDFQLAVFGAGHVAQALMSIVAGLPCKVTWVDSRAELFPASLPDNVRAVVSDDPGYELEQLPAAADVLILTHNHQLDYELTETALRHPCLNSIGLIGSDTKAQRFERRLAARGFSAEDIERLNCPVGLSVVPGKLPMEVAVSIAAQLIAARQHPGPDESGKQRGISWKTIKQQLSHEQRPVDSRGRGSSLKLSD
ncbi:xanthine dehydrogenase accessory protein XdhC [Bacterioplanoides pacificum]|uniref:Xanthine dehydrogenase accessory protein XdhC n=1 Tax=Bacterioplanoides pacificum TaxID=1171596 RepID=A0ABV7VNU1_9GAMM